MAESGELNGYNLTHPVYLDVAMMISFLAYLEGGVSTGEEETKRDTGAKERLLRGRTGLRFKLPPVANADLSGEGSTQRREESVVEARTERLHTAASLFNGLYEVLSDDGQLHTIEDADGPAQLKVGQLVEFQGAYLGNPLEDVLATLSALLPYLLEEQESQRSALEAAHKKTQGQKRSGNPAKKAAAPEAAGVLEGLIEQAEASQQEAGLKIALQMAEDIKGAPVHDLLIRTPRGLSVILTASSEYFTAATNEYLRAGEFQVVGKVTRVVRGGESVNLTRRTVLGAAGASVAEDVIGSFTNTLEGFDVPSAIVEGPCLQVLPMAIFI